MKNALLTLGATESVDWKYFNKTFDAIAELKEKGFSILALEQTDGSIMLHEFQPENHTKYAVLLGNEVKGVDDDVIKAVDKCIEIPQFGTKHSFNVAVSNGIVIWDILLKMKRI